MVEDARWCGQRARREVLVNNFRHTQGPEVLGYSGFSVQILLPVVLVPIRLGWMGEFIFLVTVFCFVRTIHISPRLIPKRKSRLLQIDVLPAS